MSFNYYYKVSVKYVKFYLSFSIGINNLHLQIPSFTNSSHGQRVVASCFTLQGQ